VLVGEQDMLQDVIKNVLRDDHALELIAECRSADELSALSERADADVVVIRPVCANVPATAFAVRACGRAPAVLGVDPKGTRGVVVLDDLSREGLRAAIHAAAALRRGGELG
jgi:hypothetical protein